MSKIKSLAQGHFYVCVSHDSIFSWKLLCMLLGYTPYLRVWVWLIRIIGYKAPNGFKAFFSDLPLKNHSVGEEK